MPWAQIYDRNIFDIQDEIAANVATSLKANYRPKAEAQRFELDA
jgi:TolB-like protein